MGSLQRQLLVAALAALSFASAAGVPARSASEKHEGGVSAAGSDKCGVPFFGDEKRSDRPTVGLALGGGGMRGAAHAGVLRVLISEGIPVDYVAGTSMGSVVGGLLASGMGPDEIEKHFTEGSLMRSFITVPLGLRLAVVPFFYLPRLVGIRQYDGFYRGNKFRDYLNKMVPACAQKIEGLGIPFCAVAVNLIDGKDYAIKSGNLGEALQASCAVPVLRRPVGIGDKLFVDGGVLVNLPVKHARDMGADMIIAVDVDETPETVNGREFKGIGGVAHRVLTLNLWKIDESQRQGADVLIHPNVNGIGLISTKTKDARAAIAAGEEAARQALPEIKRRLLELAKEKDLK